MVLSSLTPLLQAQDTRYIRFRDENPGKQLLHYRIVAIKDDRADTGAIGTLRTGLFGKKNVAVNYEGGVTAALGRYIQKNYRQDTAATPMELHITDLNIKELPGGIRTKVESLVTLSFYINDTKLTDYKGRGEVQTMGDLFKNVEDLIRDNINNSMHEFDSWWGKNKRLHAPNAPVSLTVEIISISSDSGRLAYSPGRPLLVNDFIGKADELSRAAAQTASSINVKYASKIEDGEIRVNVQVMAYFDKARSWFAQKHERNEMVLAHEQRHFELTVLKACELVDTLRQLRLTKDNYMEKLEQVHAQKMNELNAWQTQYDTETRHSANIVMQEKWNKLVKDLLGKQSCFR